MQTPALPCPLLSALALLAGCASQTASYRPLEASSQSPTGFPAAYYKMELDNHQLGDAKVWSTGGFPGQVDGEQLGLIEIHLRVRNRTGAPMSLELDRTDLELVTNNGRIAILNVPARTEGADQAIAPGDLRRLTLYWGLPEGIRAGEVSGFEINWVLKTEHGMYTESTSFRRTGAAGQGYTYYPYYYPYYYGGYRDPFWGPGWWGYPYYW